MCSPKRILLQIEAGFGLNAEGSMGNHFWRLLGTAWELLRSSLSTSNLSIIIFSICVPLILFVAAVIAKWSKGSRSWDSFLVTLKGYLKPAVVLSVSITAFAWLCLFSWAVYKTVYNDHQNLIGRLQAVVQEKDELKSRLAVRDRYIQQLTEENVITKAVSPRKQAVAASSQAKPRVRVEGHDNTAGIANQTGSGNTSQIGNDNSQISVGALTPEERRKRKEIEDHITALVEEGNGIVAKCFTAEANPELKELTNLWATKAYAYLAVVRVSYAARFNAASGFSFSYDMANGKSVAKENAYVIDFIKPRNAVLVKILEELSSDGGINQNSSGPYSPNIGVNTGTVNINPDVDPNKPVVTYDFTGVKRTATSQGVEAEVGREWDASAQMKLKSESQDWRGLASIAEEAKARAPEWLTPYALLRSRRSLCQSVRERKSHARFAILRGKGKGSANFRECFLKSKKQLA
jgi:hypothetical protein